MAKKIVSGPRQELDPVKAQAYWKRNVRLIITLLIIWAAVSYGAAILLAQPLFNIKIGSLPLSFWFAQQGSIIVFVILIFVYCWMMDRLDKEFDVQE
ncbi:MAG: DUF4212 domain-containing protein [Caldilineaceae bacterium]